MDVRIEVAAAEAQAEMSDASVKAVAIHSPYIDVVKSGQVISFSCPSIAGTSLSAVSPDYTFFGGLAYAA